MPLLSSPQLSVLNHRGTDRCDSDRLTTILHGQPLRSFFPRLTRFSMSTTRALLPRPACYAQSSLRRLHRRRRCCCRRQATAPRSRARRRRSIVCVVSVVRSLFDVVIVPVVSFEEDRRASKFVHGYYQGEEKETRQRRSRQPEMSDHGCIHLNNFKAAKGIQPYKVIHSYFVTSTSTEARIRKV